MATEGTVYSSPTTDDASEAKNVTAALHAMWTHEKFATDWTAQLVLNPWRHFMLRIPVGTMRHAAAKASRSTVARFLFSWSPVSISWSSLLPSLMLSLPTGCVKSSSSPQCRHFCALLFFFLRDRPLVTRPPIPSSRLHLLFSLLCARIATTVAITSTRLFLLLLSHLL